MSIQWPLSLRNKINASDFSLQFGETAIRTEMEYGPKKVRRRTTKGIDVISCSIMLTRSEYNDSFRPFYDTSLAGGTGTFIYTHPITGEDANFRFASPPVLRVVKGVTYLLTMAWEIVL